MTRPTQAVAEAGHAVHVIAAPHDRATAERLAEGLREMGVSVEAVADVPYAQPSHSAVVVLSRPAAADTAWKAELAWHAAARLIPVAVGDVEPGAVPAVVRPLNWIAWNDDDAVRIMVTVFAALHGDFSRYRLHRSLAAETEAWSADAHKPALLIQDRKRALEAQHHLTDAATDPLARPTPAIAAFVTASVKHTQRARRKRRNRWIRRTIGVAVAALAVLTIVLSLRSAHRNNFLGFLASDSSSFAFQPERAALLSAGTLLQGDSSMAVIGAVGVRRALSLDWSSGVLGTRYDQPLIAAVPVDDGRRVLAVDARGLLVAWNAGTGLVQWRRALADAKLLAVDATPDGKQVAAVAGSLLALVRVDPWHADTLRLPAPASMVAIAPIDGVAVVAAEDGTLWTVDLAARHRMRLRARVAGVLALRQTSDGHARALVRETPYRVAVLDAARGARLSSASVPQAEFEKGGLGADGSVALTNGERQILYAAHGLRLRPTGEAVPDVVDVLEPLSGRRIAVGSPQFGVKLLDAGRGLVLGAICTNLPAVRELRVAADGDHVTCANGWMIDQWSTRPLSPLAHAPWIAHAGRSRTARWGPLRMIGERDGSILIQPDNVHTAMRVRVARGPVSVVTFGRDGTVAAAGTRAGELVELLTDHGVQTVADWTAPDRSPVVEIGWSRDGRRLLARTAAGNWWSRPSCSDCASVAAMVEHVRRRTHGCYTPPPSESLTAATRRLLGLSPCKAPPPVS